MTLCILRQIKQSDEVILFFSCYFLTLSTKCLRKKSSDQSLIKTIFSCSSNRNLQNKIIVEKHSFKRRPFSAVEAYRCKLETIGSIHTDKQQSHLSKNAIYFKFLLRSRRAAWRGSTSCEQVNLWVTEMINWPSAWWVLVNWNCSAAVSAEPFLDTCYIRENNTGILYIALDCSIPTWINECVSVCCGVNTAGGLWIFAQM